MLLSCWICTPVSDATSERENYKQSCLHILGCFAYLGDNNSHYTLWSFLIKMTFPLSLKVDILRLMYDPHSPWRVIKIRLYNLTFPANEHGDASAQ